MSEDINTLIKGLRDNAKRLGLIWDISLATVMDPTIPSIKIDGDTKELSNEISNITGSQLQQGDRIYVLLVPPNKTYIFGFNEIQTWPRLYVCTSNLNLTDTTMTDVPNFKFQVEPGWAYYATVMISYTGPTAADIKFDWTRDNGIISTDIRRFIIGLAAGTTTNMNSSVLMPRRDGDTDQTVGADGGAGSGATTYLEHVVIIPSVKGNVGFRAAQAADTGTTEITTASRLFVQRARLS